MVLPTYLTLSEAAKRLADNTGEAVTHNWILQHAIDGRLQLFHILRQGVMADFDSASETYQPGTYLPLNTADAQWILAQLDNDWLYQIPTVCNVSGRTAWVLDWTTGKRRPIDVAFGDLHVKLAEIDMLATRPSKPLESNEGELNPEAPSAAVKVEEANHRKEVEEFREQNEEAKRKAGRYQLAEAAQFVADNSTACVDSIMAKLYKSARDSSLMVYEPGKHEPYEMNPMRDSITDAEAWLESYWNDLNDWLEKNGPHLDCKFPSPPASPAAGKVEAVKGITKQVVINAFEGMHFDRDHWGRNLATPPDWLKECRVAKGNKRTSATWNPVLIAMALTDPKRGMSVNKLDVVFVGLKDWADEWREASDYLR